MRIILLEHPRSFSPERCNDIANTPLASCLLSGYAAGMLKSRGHEVIIVEGFMDNLSYDEITTLIQDFKPELLGVHMVYHWQEDLALYNFLEQVKGAGLVQYITAYGYYPTIAFADILQKCSAVDSVMVGEHEITFVELAEAIAAGVKPVDGLPGLAVRGNLAGGSCASGPGSVNCRRRPLINDLDSLPLPVRTEAMYRLPEVNLLGSRGCYGGCTFCYINPFYGEKSRWRGRSPENIVAEIDGIMAERNFREFYFTDPNFFGPGQQGQERALKIAALLKPRQLHFGIEGRVNDIHDRSIGVLVEAGLRHLLIGLESGRDSSLKRMNKMTTVAQNEAAVGILRKHGIEPNIGFIMFEPDASLADIRENFEFLRRNDLLKNLPVTANVLYHHQIILKGTPAFQSLQQEGRLDMQAASSYEGSTTFADAQVAALANVMRQVTNFLFARMAGIWGGKVEEPQNAREKYSKINGMLITLFDDVLHHLEVGERLTEEETGALVQKAEKEIRDNLVKMKNTCAG